MGEGKASEAAGCEGWGRDRSVTAGPGPTLPDFDLTKINSLLDVQVDQARRGGWGRERSVTAGCSFIGWFQKWENQVGACSWVARHPCHTSL